VIATPAAFPGLRDAYQPMVVVDRTALAHMPMHIERAEQVWTNSASRAAASAALARDDVPVLYELSPQVVVRTTGLLPVTWVLSYLRALALLIGLVALAGLVFALSARAKRTAVAYILTRRMGVRRRTYLASLVAELALIVGVGWVAGTALAEGSVAVVYRLLDTYPQFPPVPRFVFDGTIVASLGTAAAVVVVAAAAFAQVLADRASPAETMRTI
jgi:putative ABC transport system permease protein